MESANQIIKITVAINYLTNKIITAMFADTIH